MRPERPLRLAVGLAAVAIVAIALRLGHALPPAAWLGAALSPDPGSARALIFHDAVLPRIVVALLAGAALGLAGALFQHVLRNPLASPTTLGVESGAQLALAITVIFAPGLFASGFGREAAALAGGGLVTLCVFGVAFARGFSSLSLILAGLVIGLISGALGAVLKLLNQEYVGVLYIWGAGSLDQQDWSVAAALTPRLAALGLATALMLRPLAVLTLDDSSARSLGLPLGLIRAVALGIAVLLTVAVTAQVGVIGFIGLAAPQIARFAGARRLGQRLALAPLVGACVLVAVDQAAWLASQDSLPVPAGAATALLGAPLLIWLLPRLRLGEAPVLAATLAAPRRPAARILAGLALLLLVGIALALLVQRSSGAPVLGPDLLAWRLPRVAVSLAAGAMLAIAGALLQRLTGNPMASPEVLGIGTGVAFGLVVALVLSAAPSRSLQLAAGGAGALGVLLLLFSSGVRSRFAPDHLLLTGLALAALLDAVVIGFLALGDPRAAQVLAWISGSTYGADGPTALATGFAALVAFAAVAPCLRWLDILPLGAVPAASLGLPVGLARFVLMLIGALVTAAAMLVVGPLTFVGLTGPHLARALGLVRAGPQIAGAALIGSLVIVLADWIGRIAIAPQELPAGLVAALIGAPYLILHMTRRERA